MELLYQFVNTSVNAEKQLLTWLGEAKKLTKSQISAASDVVVLKQEIVEPSEVVIVDQGAQGSLLQEETLPYQSFEYESSVDATEAEVGDEQEKPSKRPRLGPSATVVSQSTTESEDDASTVEKIAKVCVFDVEVWRNIGNIFLGGK